MLYFIGFALRDERVISRKVHSRIMEKWLPACSKFTI